MAFYSLMSKKQKAKNLFGLSRQPNNLKRSELIRQPKRKRSTIAYAWKKRLSYGKIKRRKLSNWSRLGKRRIRLMRKKSKRRNLRSKNWRNHLMIRTDGFGRMNRIMVFVTVLKSLNVVITFHRPKKNNRVLNAYLLT